MKVSLATYQAVTMLRGGPLTQVLQTKQELDRLGVHASLFNSWKDFARKDADLVHIFGANIGTYHLARELHKIGMPLVLSPIFYSRHSVDYIRRVVKIGRQLKRFSRGIWTDFGMMAEMCSWAKILAANTVDEAKLFIGGLGVAEEKVRIIPNGVEARFEKAKRSLFKKTYGVENFILNVGHIGPERKNVLRLIQALTDINQQAVIIGRIENTSEGKRCLELAAKNPRILILGSLPHDSDLLASAYAACDVFVLPSLFETPGIAALEAALSGAKIVITPHGGTKEYFEEYATYVNPNSAKSIQSGITKALGMPKDSGLRNHIKKQYLWPKIAGETLKVYETALQK